MTKQFYQAFYHEMMSDGEGYSSNDKYRIHLVLSVSGDTKLESIRPALVKHGILKPRYRWHVICFDDYMIELSRPDYSELITCERISDDEALELVTKDNYNYISL